MSNIDNFETYNGKTIKTIGFNGTLYSYLIEMSRICNRRLSQVAENSRKFEKNYMQIGEDQASFLNMLVHISRAHRIIEVGCYLGYSALAMAEALPQGGTVTTIERKQEWADIAAQNIKNLGLEQKIEIVSGEALPILSNLAQLGATFDLAFIDADKINCLKYYQIIKPMLRRGGLLNCR